MRALKVWTGRYYGNLRDAYDSAIVAAYTKKQACELLSVSYGELTNYFSLTHNQIQLETATEVGVWLTKAFTDIYVRVK